ncbi:hypothetical protein VP01_503g1, partial [Puccinia sorghi]
NAISAAPLVSPALPTGGVICSSEPIAYTANFGECLIDNPTVKTLLPGKLLASLQRYPDPSSASLPPSSGINAVAPGLTNVQLLYAPNASAPLQEQFSCQAINCTQHIEKDTYSMYCQNLKCQCNKGSFMCGGGPLDLTNTINTLSGDVGFDCPSLGNTTPPAASPCHIQMGLLKNIFGPQGFSLTGCQFGECVSKTIAMSKRQVLIDEANKKSINPGLIAALVVLIFSFLALIALVIWGFYLQHLARKSKGAGDPGVTSVAAAQVEWCNLRYHLPLKSGAASFLRRRRVPPRSHHSHVAAPLETTNFQSSLGSPSFVELPSVPRGPQILAGLSGSVGAGTMMAILGPSGAGKSTLLDVLAGQHKAGKVSGGRRIYIPGEMSQGLRGKVVVGYVDQTDILPGSSTVREALQFAARLKLPEHVSSEERDRRVEEVIHLLGLDKVADGRIGDDEKRGLSGGERRRLSIGLELIARPSVLFLDEPTSGLDSVSAVRVVKVLKALSADAPAGHGTTIICSIHQPNSQIYHAFDYVCLLAPGGRQIYCGPTSQAVTYLSARGLHCPAEFNPADFLLEVASEPPVGFLDEFSTAPKSSGSQPCKSEALKEDPSTLFPPTSMATANDTNVHQLGKPTATFITQLQAIAHREWLALKRDPSLFWVLNISSCLIGLFVGAMFFQVNLRISGFQNRVGSMFFTCTVCTFSALSALTNFYRVRVLFMRERAAGYYSATGWLLVRGIFDVIPLRLVPMVTMGTVIYWMVGLTSTAGHFVKYLLILLELALLQSLFNMLLGATFRNLGSAIFLASMANLFQLGFAGFFLNLADLSKVIAWIQFLVPIKYALEALAINEVAAGLMIDDSLQGVHVKVSATVIMKLLFGFQDDAYWRQVLILPLDAYIYIYLIHPSTKKN